MMKKAVWKKERRELIQAVAVLLLKGAACISGEHDKNVKMEDFV